MVNLLNIFTAHGVFVSMHAANEKAILYTKIAMGFVQFRTSFLKIFLPPKPIHTYKP